jgi:hypothetical protein
LLFPPNNRCCCALVNSFASFSVRMFFNMSKGFLVIPLR